MSDICYSCGLKIKSGDYCPHSDGEPTHWSCCMSVFDRMAEDSKLIDEGRMFEYADPIGLGSYLVRDYEWEQCGYAIP